MADEVIAYALNSLNAPLGELHVVPHKLQLNLRLTTGMVIAGGMANNLYRGVKAEGLDFDIFMYSSDQHSYEERLKAFVQENILYLSIHNNNYCEYYKNNFHITVIQVILRKFKSIDDILHGFDLDASQIAIDEEFFYFTEKFKRAEELKINIFNFNRASPSYIFRLNKYKTNKGYDIISPFGHLKHSKYDDSESAYKEWTPEDGDKEQSNIKYLLGLSDKFYWSKNTFFDARSFDFQKKYRKDIEHYLENGNIKGTRLEVFGEDNLHKIYLKYNQLKELDKRPEVVFIQEGLSRYRSFKDEVSYYYYFEPILERKHYSFILGTNAFVDKLSATLEKHNLSYYVDDQIDGLKEQIKTSVFYKEAMYSLRALPLDLIELITQWLSLVRIVSNYQLYSRSTNRKVINSNTSEEEDYYKSITSEEDSWYSKSIYNKGDTKDITISSTSDEDY